MRREARIMRWLLAAATGWAGVCSQPALGQLRLLNSAQSGAAVIRLSDLLPPQAGAALRQTSEGVFLGFSPEPGAERRLSGEQIRECIPAGLAAGLTVPVQVVVGRRGWPLPAGAVRSAIQEFLARRGEEPPDLGGMQWPGGILAARPGAHLQVAAARWDSQRQQFDFALRCAEARVCPPFLVRAPAARPRDAREDSLPWTDTGGELLVRAGQRAVVSVQEGGVSASRQVICLEGGRLRQSIRVKDAERAEVFRARVVGASQLAALPASGSE